MHSSCVSHIYKRWEHGLKSRYQYWHWPMVFRTYIVNIGLHYRQYWSYRRYDNGKYYRVNIISATSKFDKILPVVYWNRPILEPYVRISSTSPCINSAMFSTTSADSIWSKRYEYGSWYVQWKKKRQKYKENVNWISKTI